MARRRGIEMHEPHRFPPPWTVEELDACYVVKDSTGQTVKS